MTDSQQHDVVMPRLGLTMTEATIIEWNKADGTYVERGELLFTFESDKATLELEAPASGVLRILVPAGTTVPIQTPVAALVPAGDAPASRTVPAAAPGGEPAAGPLRASPKARHLARERTLLLDAIRGSGPRGMIVSADLAQAASDSQPVKASPVARKVAADVGVDLDAVAGTGPRGQITRVDVERHVLATQSVPVVAADEGSTGSAGDIGALTGLRGVIAGRLSQGWRERPQVTLTTDADATNLVAAREQAAAELGEKIAYDALLVMLVARALREFPYINARLTEHGIEELEAINIGVAVDTERGLLVPVVPGADGLSLAAINRTLRELAERALAGRSLPDDLTGGTFTITNLGMFGIDAFTPIINPPECAILGVGRIVARPVGLNGQIVLREMVALSLSFDHRLVDGAPAARFLARVKQLIERPFALALVP